MPDFTRKEGAPSGDFRSDNRFLLGFFEEKDGALHYRYDAERMIIEPWGDNSFRLRASKMPEMPQELWALEEKPEGETSDLIAQQLYDLALMAHKPLSAAQMTAFSARSLKIMERMIGK